MQVNEVCVYIAFMYEHDGYKIQHILLCQFKMQ